MKRVLCIVILTACGGGSSGPADAGDAVPDSDVDAGPSMCASDLDCQDGVFCNGQEQCAAGAGADERGCRPGGGDPCLMGQACDEDAARCQTDCGVNPDADRDGEPSIDCGGADCNDADPRTFPGNTEICDLDFHDEDCDPETFGFRDQDMDGFPDARCCNLDREGTPICGTDCDDLVAVVHPTEAEVCDGLDNDCDEAVDEGAMRVFWPDLDGDDFGDSTAAPVMSCMPPADHVENDGDCDDDNRARNPGAPEVCDLVPDNDCDPDTNPFDADGDGHDRVDCGGDDCVDSNPTIYEGAPELCDRIDNDCSLERTCGVFGCSGSPGGTDFREDRDEDGFAPAGICSGGPLPAEDCDDERAFVRPGAPEHCNGVDDDCDPSTSDPSDCITSTTLVGARLTSGGRAFVIAMEVDADGNSYVVAHLQAETNAGAGAVGREGVYLLSHRPNGTLRWSLFLVEGTSIFASDVLAWTTTGNLVVVGSDWTPGNVAGTALPDRGGLDIFLAEVNPTTGAVLRVDSMGGAGSDRVSSVETAPSGDVYVLGQTNSTEMTLPDGSALTIPGEADARRHFLFRMRAGAPLRWHYFPSADDPCRDFGFERGIASDLSAGRVYFAWRRTCSTGALTALEDSGAEIWTVDAGASEVAVDAAGNVYVQGGHSEGSRVTSYTNTGAFRWEVGFPAFRVNALGMSMGTQAIVLADIDGLGISTEGTHAIALGRDGGIRGVERVGDWISAALGYEGPTRVVVRDDVAYLVGTVEDEYSIRGFTVPEPERSDMFVLRVGF
ncbi:MAG: putative metal-binding motif-containing protein [Myxococcota bacterium]